MSYQDNINKWHQYAASRGVRESLYRAPLDRLCLRLGLSAPPFLFWNPFLVYFASAILVAMFWGGVMNLVTEGASLNSQTLIASLEFGTLGSLVNLFYLLYCRRKLKITTWRRFLDSQNSNRSHG
jgi:hypothetical protein